MLLGSLSLSLRGAGGGGGPDESMAAFRQLYIYAALDSRCCCQRSADLAQLMRIGLPRTALQLRHTKVSATDEAFRKDTASLRPTHASSALIEMRVSVVGDNDWTVAAAWRAWVSVQSAAASSTARRFSPQSWRAPFARC